jgi:hypothetical protein
MNRDKYIDDDEDAALSNHLSPTQSKLLLADEARRRKPSLADGTDRSLGDQIHDENEVTGEQLIDYFGGRVPDVAFTFLRADGGYQQHQKRAMMVYMGLVFQEGRNNGRIEMQAEIDILRERLSTLEKLEEGRKSAIFQMQMEAAKNGNTALLLHLGEVVLGQNVRGRPPASY